MRINKLLLATGLFSLLAITGCGGDRRSPVKGTVNVAGKGPLTGGNIRFVLVSDQTKMSGGIIKPDGTYEVPDAPVGECLVVIDNSHLDPNSLKGISLPGTGGGMGGPGGMGGMKGAPKTGGPAVSGPKSGDKAKMANAPKSAEVPEGMDEGKDDLSGQKFLKIDPTFSKPETTPLRATIKSGDNEAVVVEVKQ